ncbi:hypothetical protein COS64_04185 [archaeon CG06_land_8_20_14_3_00_37_11]|nr:MAG: hypothetical protein COS64_04185 [archaeon CG06_land_8_20_14_3_00_37_11]
MNDLLLMQIILGDIAVNKNYGIVMKKWRELFNITQSDVAKELNIKQSVISDYENNRRNSPGIEFLRNYVKALIKVGREEHKKEYEGIKNNLGIKNIANKLFAGEFMKELTTKQVLNRLKAVQIVSQPEQAKFKNYLFLSDRITSILMKQPTYKLLKNLKSKEGTIYVFSNVKTGKIPLITLKILSKLNRIQMPKLVIFQSDNLKLSGFARRTAKTNNITIGVTKEDNNTIKSLLNVNARNTINV